MDTTTWLSLTEWMRRSSSRALRGIASNKLMSHHLDLRAHLVAPRRTDEDRTRADPLTRLERLECKVAARNHTIKLRFGLSIAETLRLGPGLGFHGQLCLGKGQCNDF